LKHPFSRRKPSADKKCLRSVLKRHRAFSIRIPQGISAAGIIIFTPENEARFFDIQEPALKEINY
jgi:hypothetical protein